MKNLYVKYYFNIYLSFLQTVAMALPSIFIPIQ